MSPKKDFLPIYCFKDRKPQIGLNVYIAPPAQIIGAVTIGKQCYIGHGADYGTIIFPSNIMIG
jgi:carbonic anhydrase/acetyltransferase-like protein (isoleucine patch superfamily)